MLTENVLIHQSTNFVILIWVNTKLYLPIISVKTFGVNYSDTKSAFIFIACRLSNVDDFVIVAQKFRVEIKKIVVCFFFFDFVS